MNQEIFIQDKVKNALEALYGASGVNVPLQLQATRKEFEGDITLVVFPLLKTSRKAPEATAQEIGEWLKANVPEVESFNVVKGFLNIKFSASFWKEVYASIAADKDFGRLPASGKTVMVEYSSPICLHSGGQGFRPSAGLRQDSYGGIFLAEYQQAAASGTYPQYPSGMVGVQAA